MNTDMNTNHTIDTSHAKVSPTAKLVAYSRQFTDIPYATEISIASKAEEVTKKMFEGFDFSLDEIKQIAPSTEARYKCFLSAIRNLGIKQVLEFASGLSFRGFVMSEDKDMVYVETDLPGIMSERAGIIEENTTLKRISTRSNLHFHNVNVLHWEEIEPALQHFNPSEPIAVIHEGLFMYLSFSEKEIAAKNIKRILEKFKGVWLTPDIGSKEQMKHRTSTMERFQNMAQAIAKSTNRDFADRTFETDEHMHEFFNNLGFHIEKKSQLDGTFALSSLKNISISQEYLDKMADYMFLWKLTLK